MMSLNIRAAIFTTKHKSGKIASGSQQYRRANPNIVQNPVLIYFFQRTIQKHMKTIPYCYMKMVSTGQVCAFINKLDRWSDTNGLSFFV